MNLSFVFYLSLLQGWGPIMPFFGQIIRMPIVFRPVFCAEFENHTYFCWKSKLARLLAISFCMYIGSNIRTFWSFSNINMLPKNVYIFEFRMTFCIEWWVAYWYLSNLENCSELLRTWPILIFSWNKYDFRIQRKKLVLKTMGIH